MRVSGFSFQNALSSVWDRMRYSVGLALFLLILLPGVSICAITGQEAAAQNQTAPDQAILGKWQSSVLTQQPTPQKEVAEWDFNADGTFSWVGIEGTGKGKTGNGTYEFLGPSRLQAHLAHLAGEPWMVDVTFSGNTMSWRPPTGVINFTKVEPQTPSQQSATGGPGAAAMTNDDVIKLVQAKLRDAVIISKIISSRCKFDTSTDSLLRLKEGGVSDSVIEAMISAGKVRSTSSSQSEIGSTANLPTNKASSTEQPIVFLLDGDKKTALYSTSTRIAQAKAKGDSLGSYAADSAVDSVLSTAAMEVTANVAASAIASTGSAMAAVPFVGAVSAVPILLMGRHKPTVTDLWALPNRNSQALVQTEKPKFEVIYADIVGVNPDEFEPVIVRLVPTEKNWRLVGATKSKIDVFKATTGDWQMYSDFSEERVVTSLNKVGRGHAEIEVSAPLPAGEYGIVFRPVSKTKKFSGTDVASGQGEGALFNRVWDFSIAAKSTAQ